MVEDQRSEAGRRLTVEFSAWFDEERIPAERFYQEGLLVLDANVLLDLYRMTPEARTQVLGAFRSVADRLWVPHQAALEFSRNRKRAVEDRMSSFRQTKHALKTASDNASNVIERAIGQLQKLRERTGTSRKWGEEGATADQKALRTALDQAIAPALTEISALEAEQDLFPKDVQSSDPLLAEIDDILDGKIGRPFSHQQLRVLVEEAHLFRYPNKMPPGYLDADKDTDLRSSGDYLVWRQTLDKATEGDLRERLILLITSDFKADWWELDRNHKPLGPRRELIQEMRDIAQADLMLTSLKEFLGGAQSYLASGISSRTIEELEVLEQSEISADEDEEPFSEDLTPFAGRINVYDLSPRDFERLIRYLLTRMGYRIRSEDTHTYRGFDFIVTRPEAPDNLIIVEARQSNTPIIARRMFELAGALRSGNYTSALFITNARIGQAAKVQASKHPIRLIDGTEFVDLLDKFGIEVDLYYD
ncbi:PIN-like domain-containing protein [Nonomuraea angiospora]|uniref:PIN like domain-containing protein n=1 Tax=Nonomuraea angiospora TaxID=46172 RepID=A0ABR9M1K8_9ACTN|nr:PIN-like domain-containing protein [Nonomuraea angiospora]MBE1586769.1 hypothetical protein [Nonomuraea angiospora]